jgi:flagellar basal-body rod protein FlgF
MNKAIYSATTGMLNRSRALDVTASNLANASTTGYKRDRLITSTFGESVALRLDGAPSTIGADTRGAIVEEVVTDYSQGVFEATGRALDFAIAGDGYFSIETADGQEAATRDGSFAVDPEGFLRTAAGGYVLGQNGRIEVGAGVVTIDQSGVVYSDGQVVDTLAILVPGEDGNAAAKEAPNALERPEGEGTFTGRILQGTLERSNVDMLEEMTAMMAASRAFQSCAQAVRILDTINQKAVNEIGRL